MLNNSHVFFRKVIYTNYNFIQTFSCVVYCRVVGTCIPQCLPLSKIAGMKFLKKKKLN